MGNTARPAEVVLLLVLVKHHIWLLSPVLLHSAPALKVFQNGRQETLESLKVLEFLYLLKAL